MMRRQSTLWGSRCALLVLLGAATVACASLRSSSADGPPPAATPQELDANIHLALGLPTDADAQDELLLDRGEFIVSYSPELNTPNWVAWRLNQQDLGRIERGSSFYQDPLLPEGLYPVSNVDYDKSILQRGHLCPAADRTSTVEANRTTFVFSNVQPQRRELNQGPWKVLEEHERALAKTGRELFIVAGGIFAPEPQRIGLDQRVAVPTFSYKIIVVLEPGQGPADVTADTEIVAVKMPNDQSVQGVGYGTFAVSIDQIEEASGYDFLRRVPAAVQEQLEARGP
jgi:endonuclease G